MAHIWRRITVTAVALLLIGARLIWPTLKIDVVTVGLCIVAILPWLDNLIESAKFPGGWEVKFRDLKEAGEMIAPAEKGTATGDTSQYLTAVAEQDPNLALVALRIEIEKRIRRLAELRDLGPRQPLTRLFRELQRREILTHQVFSGLDEIVMAGNQAAHGARVEPTVADWAFTYGPDILAALDQVVEDARSNNAMESDA